MSHANQQDDKKTQFLYGRSSMEGTASRAAGRCTSSSLQDILRKTLEDFWEQHHNPSPPRPESDACPCRLRGFHNTEVGWGSSFQQPASASDTQSSCTSTVLLRFAKPMHSSPSSFAHSPVLPLSQVWVAEIELHDILWRGTQDGPFSTAALRRALDAYRPLRGRQLQSLTFVRCVFEDSSQVENLAETMRSRPSIRALTLRSCSIPNPPLGGGFRPLQNSWNQLTTVDLTESAFGLHLALALCALAKRSFDPCVSPGESGRPVPSSLCALAVTVFEPEEVYSLLPTLWYFENLSKLVLYVRGPYDKLLRMCRVRDSNCAWMQRPPHMPAQPGARRVHIVWLDTDERTMLHEEHILELLLQWAALYFPLALGISALWEPLSDYVAFRVYLMPRQ